MVQLPTYVSRFLLALSLVSASSYATAEESGLQELTPEELERYEFEVEETPATVTDLSLGQRYALSTQRREIGDLIARRLGILELKGEKSDLKVLQDLVDRKAIRSTDVREWQGLGILFGDILVNEFGLHWVSYEDDLGASKALRWKETDNFVFPVTLFSKRVQFNEKINVLGVYDKLKEDIEQFKAYEENRPVFN